MRSAEGPLGPLPGRLTVLGSSATPDPEAADGGAVVRIQLADGNRGAVVEVEIRRDCFAAALFSRSEVPCLYEVRPYFGTESQHLSAQVLVPDGPWETREERAAQAVAEYAEALQRGQMGPGWRGRVDDALNSNRRGESHEEGTEYTVGFDRLISAYTGAHLPPLLDLLREAEGWLPDEIAVKVGAWAGHLGHLAEAGETPTPGWDS